MPGHPWAQTASHCLAAKQCLDKHCLTGIAARAEPPSHSPVEPAGSLGLSLRRARMESSTVRNANMLLPAAVRCVGRRVGVAGGEWWVAGGGRVVVNGVDVGGGMPLPTPPSVQCQP